MEDKIQNGTELKFTIRNSFKDIYIGYLLMSCMPPYLWGNLVLFLIIGYLSTFPLLQMKEYTLVAFSLASNILIVAAIFALFPLVMAGSMFFTKKLKGVVGEHDFTFGPHGFIEKTPYNEHHLLYSGVVRFCETRKHYLLVMQGMNAFMLPKRDLSADMREGLKKKLQGVKPLQKIFAHYAMLALVVAAAISLPFALSMAKHIVSTNAIPFRAVWDADTLYINAGKMMTGQVLRYSDMLGIGAPSMGGQPQIASEQRFWVVREGRIEPYIIQTTMNPAGICLSQGRLYALHYDMKTKKKMLSFFTPDAFEEDQSRSPEDVFKDCDDRGSQGESAQKNTISFYEWDERVGSGKNLEITLGGHVFALGVNREEGQPNSDQGLFGGSETETIKIMGRWVAGQAQKAETLYITTTGMKVVDRETYERYFGK